MRACGRRCAAAAGAARLRQALRACRICTHDSFFLWVIDHHRCAPAGNAVRQRQALRACRICKNDLRQALRACRICKQT
jgi:hypothetical protein